MAVLKTFIVECIFEPRGEQGLEGYQLEERYQVEKCESEKNPGKIYYRVYLYPEYYETCGKISFFRYFKEVENTLHGVK